MSIADRTSRRPTPRHAARTAARTAAVLLPLALLAGRAAAQERGDWALNVTMPSAVGVTWHATDRWALRPDVNLNLVRTSSAGSQTGLVPGVSVMRLGRAAGSGGGAGGTRGYAALRYAHPAALQSSGTIWGARQLSLNAGLLHRASATPFAIFAEAGPAVSWQRASTGFGTTSATSWSLRTLIGLSWYP